MPSRCCPRRPSAPRAARAWHRHPSPSRRSRVSSRQGTRGARSPTAWRRTPSAPRIPVVGRSWRSAVPSVRMMRQPPAYVPADIARAALTMTQVGGRVKSSSRFPVETSASAMIPIVFCASFVPCVRATKPPETSCPLAEDPVDPGGRPPPDDPDDRRHQREGERERGERRDQRRLQDLVPEARPLDHPPALRHDR